MVAVRRFGLALTFGLFLLGACCFLIVALVQGAAMLHELRLETAGVPATGTVTATRACTITIFTGDAAQDDQLPGETLTIRYTDRHGAVHVAQTQMCLQQSYAIGTVISIRYLPDDPTTIATATELQSGHTFLLVDLALLAAMLLFAIFAFRALLRGLRLVRTAQRRHFATLPPYQDAPIPRIVPPAPKQPWELP